MHPENDTMGGPGGNKGFEEMDKWMPSKEEEIKGSDPEQDQMIAKLEKTFVPTLFDNENLEF